MAQGCLLAPPSLMTTWLMWSLWWTTSLAGAAYGQVGWGSVGQIVVVVIIYGQPLAALCLNPAVHTLRLAGDCWNPAAAHTSPCPSMYSKLHTLLPCA